MGYLELGIIFIGAIGAALLLGTGAALVRYRRTGTFPGQDEAAEESETAGAVRMAIIKMLIGAALVLLGLRALAEAGVFG